MVRPHSSSTPSGRDWVLVDISEFILIGGPPSVLGTAADAGDAPRSLRDG
jgi:hypothetical protein